MDLEQNWVIYSLAEPTTGTIRYIGFTSQNPPEKRFREHLCESIKANTHLGAWLRKLRRDGLEPLFFIMKRGCGDMDWKAEERKWIRLFSAGHKGWLVNHTDGGDGAGLNVAPGAEALRQKRSESAKKRWKDPIYREKGFLSQRKAALARAEALRVKWQDPAYRKKTLAVLRSNEDKRLGSVQENWRDPAFREKQAAGLQTKWQDPEYCSKMHAVLQANRERRKKAAM